uniref:Uncharacterized protein n=1 Tax=Anopheles albimanus TaxID=7167 RepID=A0A182FMA8_ANOAL
MCDDDDDEDRKQQQQQQQQETTKGAREHPERPWPRHTARLPLAGHSFSFGKSSAASKKKKQPKQQQQHQERLPGPTTYCSSESVASDLALEPDAGPGDHRRSRSGRDSSIGGGGGRLLNWMRNAPGFRKLNLRRWNSTGSWSPEPAGTIDLTNFHVSEGNYTKRKNVFRLATASTGSYCPLEAAAIATGSATGGFHPHTEVHRTQSTSGLASTDVVTPSSTSTTAPDREILVQADSASDMQQWMEALRSVCLGDGEADGDAGAALAAGEQGRTPDTTDQPLRSPDYLKSLGGQQAEPQRVAALTSVQLPSGGQSGDDYSPILPTKAQRKYALGTRSPSGQSPVTKSRKTPGERCSSPAAVPPSATPAMPIHAQSPQHHQQPYNQLATYQQQQQHGHASGGSDRENGSPKSKTWKGIVARQFRKMQGQPSPAGGCQHPYQPHLQQQQQQQQQQHLQQQEQQQYELLPFADGASINVPLQHCPMSEEHPYVPLVLAKCTGVVESRGLGVVGIYRIPGNTAAIAQLTDTINRGLDEAALQDPRWEDVNVVSSLLKSFIRNLPEPLLPNALYGGFIAADKLGGQRRLIELRQLLHRIPRLHYETLKHLLRHLHRVSTHSEVNLMDPRNLAIVFGPSVVRSANESLETAVKDMRHQCQIVEVLINYYQYFFEDGPLPAVDEKPNGGNAADSPMEVPTTTLLLDNVSKLEPFKDASNRDTTAGFVANIVQAANRKIRRTAQRKSTMSSTTPDTLSLDSTTSAESKEQSMRSITRSRYLEMGGTGGTGGGSAASAGTTARRTAPERGSLSEDPVPVTAATAGLAVGDPGAPGPVPLPRHRTGAPSVVPMEESLLQLHHHHHHHHHYYHSNRHHSSQSNDDASLVLNRSSEDDSNDSAFADNGSMSLKTVTIALDNKLRSLRNSSIDSDRDNALDSEGELSGSCCSGAMLVDAGNLRHSLHQKYQRGRTQRPLTLGGENIPYADESPERPLVQGRAAKPGSTSDGGASGTGNDTNGNSSNVNNIINNNNNNNNDSNTGSTRTTTHGNEGSIGGKKSTASQGSAGNAYTRSNVKINNNNNNNNQEESSLTAPNRVQQAVVQRKGPAQQRSVDGSGGSSGNSSTNNSCLTLVSEVNTVSHGEAVDQSGKGGREDANDDDDDDGDAVGRGSCKKLSNPSPPPPPCTVLSSDETDSSTTSNPREKLVAASGTTASAGANTAAAAPYRIDTEVLKKMNRILTQLERKANNLERKFNLNRSLSLNYKTPKALDCCCCGHHHEAVVPLLATALSGQHHVVAAQQQQQQQQQQQPHCYQQLLATGGSTGAGSTIPPCQHGSTTCMHVPAAAPPLALSLRSRLTPGGGWASALRDYW